MLSLLIIQAILAVTPVVRAAQPQSAFAWHTESEKSLTVRWQGDRRLGAIAHEAWDEARQRYPPHTNITANVTVASDTDNFRQLARQPGWMLASTQGNRIVTQSEAILQRYGGAESVFLHEMLHVLVEADATRSTPLWLREGLVEVLAGTVVSQQSHLSVTEIERGLQQPASWHESQVAHHAAATLVATLVARYGIGAVRGWLKGGVPAGVLAAAAG